jgi:hypothetical protein
MVGPEVALLSSAEQKITTDSANIETSVRTGISNQCTKVNAAAALNVTYTLFNTVMVGAGYSYDFINVAKYVTSAKGTLNNSNIKFFVTYKWNAK